MIKLAVYGHYDSRGGTTAVAVSEFTDEMRAQADERYNQDFGLEKREDAWVWDGTDYGSQVRYEDTPASQDWLGWADLDEGDLDPKIDDDLDWNERTWVLAEGDPGNEDDFVEWPESGFLRLKLVSVGTKVEGFVHPRWDDDAFSFLLVRR